MDSEAQKMADRVAGIFLGGKAKVTRPRIRCVKCQKLHTSKDRWTVICNDCRK